MNRILLLLTVFSLGYVMNDLVREYNFNVIDEVRADVAGMNWEMLRRDFHFKKAVLKTVDGNCHVDGTGVVMC